ncbi:hypothetical protein ACFQZJ_01320 [Maribacter chungangensis]|uniref:Uncharacterized protein n=1 Tax=Maribacter chungangensis TaxID=1069117 RepID=A0ABW3B0D2_9FLAO
MVSCGIENWNNIPKPNLLISRKAVADFMVDCLKELSKNNSILTISNPWDYFIFPYF